MTSPVILVDNNNYFSIVAETTLEEHFPAITYTTQEIKEAVRKARNMEIPVVIAVRDTFLNGPTLRYIRTTKKVLSSLDLYAYSEYTIHPSKSNVYSRYFNGVFQGISTADQLLNSIWKLTSSPTGGETNETSHSLSKIEVQVLQHWCAGKNAYETSLEVFRSPRTVEGIRRRIRLKTNLNRLSDLNQFARENGLLFD